nr:MAG TPA: Pilin glycosylation protein-handed beta-helix, rossmann fold, acetyltransferase.67A [Caudoviricetes sp.]
MVKYTDDKITVNGVDLYRIEETNLIGKNVYAAKSASIGDETSIGDRAIIGDRASIGDRACIGDRARIGAWAIIGAGARYDIMLIGPGGSRNSYTTIWRHKDGRLRVTTGCFTGTLDELAAAAKKTHGDNQHGKYYLAMIEFIKASMGEYRQVDDGQN